MNEMNFAVVGGSLLLVSVVLVMISSSQSDFYALAVELEEKGGRAEATITAVDCTVTRSTTQERGVSSSEACTAEVSFQTLDGQTVESTMASGLPRGSTFEILYDPEQPERFVAERHLREGGGLTLIVVGGLAGLLGVALIGVEIRNRRRKRAAARPASR